MALQGHTQEPDLLWLSVHVPITPSASLPSGSLPAFLVHVWAATPPLDISSEDHPEVPTPPPFSSWPVATKHHGLVNLNNRHLFLTVLEAGHLRAGCLRGQDPFLAVDGLFSLCPHVVFLGACACRELLSLPLSEGTNPSMGPTPQPHRTLMAPRAPPPNTMPPAVRASTCGFGGM